MKHIFFIEDPHDPDACLAQTIDPLQRPRYVDEEQQVRAAQPPMGEGTYTRECVECGFLFKSEDREACLCDPCDREDADRLSRGWEWHAYPARRFRQ
jgi:hypothetical protein